MKEKLYWTHVFVLVFMTQNGVALFSLPQVEAQYFGTNGWLCLPILCSVVMLNISLIAVVYRLGKGRSIFEILEQSIPKWILVPLYLALTALWVLLGCMVAKEYLFIFQMVAFPTTNPMMFKLLFDVLVFSLMVKGIYNISKAAMMFFWLIIWMNLLLFFFYSNFEWARLTPFVFKGSQSVMGGMVKAYTAFLGYELILLLFPYSNKKTKLIKSAALGNLLVTVSYIYVSFISFGFFSHDQLKRLVFPLLDLMAYIKLPFIERIENLFYGFFMFSVLLTSTMYTWSAREASSRIFPKVNPKWVAAVLLSGGYIYAFIPGVLNDVQSMLFFLSYIEMGIAFGLPSLLICLLLIQRMKGGKARG